jgi:hypothetical protein
MHASVIRGHSPRGSTSSFSMRTTSSVSNYHVPVETFHIDAELRLVVLSRNLGRSGQPRSITLSKSDESAEHAYQLQTLLQSLGGQMYCT